MFRLAYYGGGGFPIDALYDLPVIWRRFYLGLLSEAKEEELEAAQNAQNNTISKDNTPTPDRYNFLKAIPKT